MREARATARASRRRLPQPVRPRECAILTTACIVATHTVNAHSQGHVVREPASPNGDQAGRQQPGRDDGRGREGGRRLAGDRVARRQRQPAGQLRRRSARSSARSSGSGSSRTSPPGRLVTRRSDSIGVAHPRARRRGSSATRSSPRCCAASARRSRPAARSSSCSCRRATRRSASSQPYLMAGHVDGVIMYSLHGDDPLPGAAPPPGRPGRRRRPAADRRARELRRQRQPRRRAARDAATHRLGPPADRDDQRSARHGRGQRPPRGLPRRPAMQAGRASTPALVVAGDFTQESGAQAMRRAARTATPTSTPSSPPTT